MALIYDDARNGEMAVYKLKAILNSNWVEAEAAWVREAALTLIAIHLKDVLQILDKAGLRISFADDVETGGDITTLATNFRNAVCHIGSPLRHMDERKNTLALGTIFGSGILVSGPGYTLENPYGDDIAFFYGRYRLLLRRQIHRATIEAVEALKSERAAHGWHMPLLDL